MAMLEARKKKLAAEGLFDAARKKPIPFLPRSIGVVTSPTGAVIRDIMHRLADRCPRRCWCGRSAVQGDRAPAEIAAAIRGFNALPRRAAAARRDHRRARRRLVRGPARLQRRGGGARRGRVRDPADLGRRARDRHDADRSRRRQARADADGGGGDGGAGAARACRDAAVAEAARLARRLAPDGHAAAAAAGPRARAAPGGCAVRACRASASMPPARGCAARCSRTCSAIARASCRRRHCCGRESSPPRSRPAATIWRKLEPGCSAPTDTASGRQRTRSTGARAFSKSLSYRAILGRGFALIRGPLGELRRRAAEVVPGESLALIFDDGETRAVATKDKPIRAAKPGQGDLF